MNNQTEKICLAAVSQNGYALQYVKVQTEKICLAVVSVDGIALEYVDNQTEKICLAAVSDNRHALRFVDNITYNIYKIYCTKSSKSLKVCLDDTRKKRMKDLTSYHAIRFVLSRKLCNDVMEVIDLWI